MTVVSLAGFGGNLEGDGVHKGDDGVKERLERGIDVLGDQNVVVELGDALRLTTAAADALLDLLDIDLGEADALDVGGVLDDGELVCLVLSHLLIAELAGEAVGNGTGAGLCGTAEALDVVLSVAVGLDPLHRAFKGADGGNLPLGGRFFIAGFHLYFLLIGFCFWVD